MKKTNERKEGTEIQKNTAKGITLVALVVTIIVLIILAAVSISLVLGEHGLLKMAREGRDNYAVATNEETTQLTDIEDTIDEIVTGKKKPKVEEIKSATVDGDIKIKLSISGTEVNFDTPPNPDESIFEHVEGTTVANGYVIRDKSSNPNTNGNEFVWVPVKKDQKLKLEVTSTADITSIELKDPFNETIDIGISGNIGTSYINENITPTKNGGYTATVKTASETQTLMLPVRSLYAQDAYNDYADAQGKASSSYTEPTTEPVAQQIANIKTSVNNNGGFYIARYEAGQSGTNNRQGKNTDDTAQTIITANGMPVSKANQKPYNFITQSQAKDLAESMYTGKSFTCTLPTGAAWDRTLGWIIETENNGLDLEKVTKDSSDWGNYNNNVEEYNVISTAQGATDGKNYSPVSKKPASKMMLTTGAAPTRNVSNNIFDLAGNVYEWTTEVAYSTLVYRGGSYVDTDSNNPSSIRLYSSATSATYPIGFRPALYVK